jgi:hypothetical protein
MRKLISLAITLVITAAVAVANPGTSDDLKKYMKELNDAQRAGDVAKAAKMTKALLPDEATLRSMFKADAPTETIDKFVAFHARFSSAREEDVAGFFNIAPERTEIHVHGATAEDVVKYEEGSVAFNEFPGGAREICALIKPQTMLYEVEFVEPGKDAGMKFHLFVWDGSGWKMLGPLWRAMR